MFPVARRIDAKAVSSLVTFAQVCSNSTYKLAWTINSVIAMSMIEHTQPELYFSYF